MVRFTIIKFGLKKLYFSFDLFCRKKRFVKIIFLLLIIERNEYILKKRFILDPIFDQSFDFIFIFQIKMRIFIVFVPLNFPF